MPSAPILPPPPAPDAPSRRDGSAPIAHGKIVVAVQGHPDQAVASAWALAARLRARFAPLEPVVLVSSHHGGGVTLVPLEPAGPTVLPGEAPGVTPAASQGAIPGYASPLGPLLRAGVERGAAVVAIVAAEAHDESIDWLERLLSPVLDGSFDLVCPAYRRYRTDGAINTGIVAPLIRTLYGQALHQPLGTETAISAAFARRLLADEDWRRRPAEAGSDAWLIARALAGDARVAQAWLGAWPRPSGGPEDLDETLVRALGLVFGEMERSAAHWQRTRPSRPVPTFGSGGFEPGGERPDPARLFESFARGLRDLLSVWSLVLPPATLLALQRCAARPVEAGGLPDELWARAVFDFSVAHLTHRVERRQLLRSLAPLYLGWLAGLARAASTLDEAGFEARVEATANAFESEKRYLIARWRWPDEFNP
jgi:glucosylglycerate synthase